MTLTNDHTDGSAILGIIAQFKLHSALPCAIFLLPCHFSPLNCTRIYGITFTILYVCTFRICCQVKKVHRTPEL